MTAPSRSVTESTAEHAPRHRDASYSEVIYAKHEPKRWPICERVDDRRLGLTFNQLTESWAPLGLPESWSEALAAHYATGAWLLLSRIIGRQMRSRTGWSRVAQGLMDVVVADIPPRATPFGHFADVYYGLDERQVGRGLSVGAHRSTWKRMVAYFAALDACGKELFDVHASRGSRPWAIRRVDDYDVLDAAWERAEELADGGALLPVLPIPVLCAFAPPRRIERLHAAEGGEMVVRVPSTWELAATALFLGEEEWARRGAVALRRASERRVPARGRNKPKAPSTRTLDRYAEGLNSIARAMRAIAPLLPPLDAQWSQPASKIELTRSMKARAEPGEPRMSPPLPVYRRWRCTWLAKLARARAARIEGTSFARSHTATALKRLLLMDLGLDLRENEIATLRVRHVSAGQALGDGVVAPAVWVTPSKGTNVQPHWKAILPQTYEMIIEWLAGWGVTDLDAERERPVFPESEHNPLEPADPRALAAFFTGSSPGCQPAIPHPLGGGYGLHEVRHLAAQLANGVGAEWQQHRADVTERVDTRVFVRAQLHHEFRGCYDYEDLEANRQLWAMRTCLGDERAGIPGVLHYAIGSAGSRRRWDDAAIRSAASRRAAGEEGCAAALREQEAALREVRRAERALMRAPVVSAEVEDAEPMRALVLLQNRVIDMQCRDALRDSLDAAKERRRTAERAFERAERIIVRADAELALIEARGRSVLMDDLEPLPSERPTGDVVPELESFAEALYRVTAGVSGTRSAVRIDSLVGDEEIVRCRELLNVNEFAAVHDVTPRATRRYMDGSRTGPLPTEQLTRATVGLGQRLRFIAVSLLPPEWAAELTISQQEMVEQILRVPMGTTQFGGPGLSSEQEHELLQELTAALLAAA
jgi:hypothetical protein